MIFNITGQTREEQAAQELADIIAGECPYCGELVIRQIQITNILYLFLSVCFVFYFLFLQSTAEPI